MIDANMKLSDDILEGISGGRPDYSEGQLKQAGVMIEDENGKKTFFVKNSKGVKTQIDKNVALDLVDCYRIAGGKKLSGTDVDALIAQCQ